MSSKGYCLVTGAAGGIGKALVASFTDAGYAVIGVDCVPKPPATRCGFWCDVDLAAIASDPAYATVFFNRIEEITGDKGIRALINNAAVQILGGVSSLTREEWSKTLHVNLLAPFFLAQGLIAPLEKAQGVIVNVGSIHSRLTKASFVAYATSKAALKGLTQAMAVDLGGRVRINMIEPAAIETDMLKAGFEGNPEAYNALAKSHPTGKIGKPEEVAKLALMLVESDIPFLHGSCLTLDGAISNRLHDPI